MCTNFNLVHILLEEKSRYGTIELYLIIFWITSAQLTEDLQSFKVSYMIFQNWLVCIYLVKYLGILKWTNSTYWLSDCLWSHLNFNSSSPHPLHLLLIYKGAYSKIIILKIIDFWTIGIATVLALKDQINAYFVTSDSAVKCFCFKGFVWISSDCVKTLPLVYFICEFHNLLTCAELLKFKNRDT